MLSIVISLMLLSLPMLLASMTSGGKEFHHHLHNIIALYSSCPSRFKTPGDLHEPKES